MKRMVWVGPVGFVDLKKQNSNSLVVVCLAVDCSSEGPYFGGSGDVSALVSTLSALEMLARPLELPRPAPDVVASSLPGTVCARASSLFRVKSPSSTAKASAAGVEATAATEGSMGESMLDVTISPGVLLSAAAPNVGVPNAAVGFDAVFALGATVELSRVVLHIPLPSHAPTIVDGLLNVELYFFSFAYV